MVTLKDIAREAGVCVQTVSDILNCGDLRYREVLRARVKAIARKLGYRPHRQAQAIRTGKTKLIGVLMPFGFYQITWERIKHIARAIESAGYEAFIQDITSMPLSLELERMLDMRVEGLIAGGMSGAMKKTDIQLLQNAGIPVVIINDLQYPGVSVIRADIRQGMGDLTQHLIRTGHRRLTLLVGGNRNHWLPERQHWPVVERILGFHDAVQSAKGQLLNMPELRQDKCRHLRSSDLRKKSAGIVGEIFPCDYSMTAVDAFEAGRRSMLQLLQKSSWPQAVLCTNDHWAVGALSVCAGRGIRVPQDMAIAGFDNTLMGQYISPPLTTIAQPIEAMAQKAVEILLKLKRDGVKACPASRLIRLPCRLVVRQSCGCQKS